ncbi:MULTISPECIES: MFS transporter [Gordonia]|uniref:MFS transporter n=1 Tax=Gordonia TaxID=2053 RepID=UPI0007E94FCA|nr:MULTISPECIES: MFS transporter [Gordonia]OBB99844.1 MFS transporter [Gordonia sp. 852002-50395_SCH5434458]OBC09465.1 MFS transporter [Gordonia sp. 852002-50816_SCH5313054-a]OBC13267.1 MFS transporter [Gordonia sp. 852002-50816_SCH5313054-c]
MAGLTRTRLTRENTRAAWLILIACAAVSMVVAAMAALNTALADIAIDIGADSSQMTWIVDGYTLALAALLLPAGAIGDRFGRREVLIVGLVVFSVASLLAIWTTDPTQLICTRILAGVAAALIMPTTLSLITSGVPADKRSIAVSIWAAVAGAGAIAGFFVTGVLLEFFSWHSIFITFAASALVTALLCLTIGTSRDSNPGHFDFGGTALSVLGVTGIVFGLLEAPHRGWGDALVLVALIGGLLLLVAFCLLELRITDPLLDVRLFTNRAFGSGALSVALQFFASFGAFYLLLQRLQLVMGYSPLQSAFALMPMVIGVSAFALVGNWVAVRFHSLRFVLAGGILVAGIGMLLLGLIDYDSYPMFAAMTGVISVGIGLATAPSTTAIMSNTPLDNQGVGSAVNDTARELGAAIGIAIAGSLLAAGYSARIGATSTLAHDQLDAAGRQRIAAGDTAGGQALLVQADEASTRIGKSLAEATEVAHRLPEQASGLARAILDGAQDAFITPMNQACVVLGAVLLAGSAVLLWLAPRRVVAVTYPDNQTDPDMGEPVTKTNEFGWADDDRQRSTDR